MACTFDWDYHNMQRILTYRWPFPFHCAEVRHPFLMFVLNGFQVCWKIFILKKLPAFQKALLDRTVTCLGGWHFKLENRESRLLPSDECTLIEKNGVDQMNSFTAVQEFSMFFWQKNKFFQVKLVQQSGNDKLRFTIHAPCITALVCRHV